MTSLNFFYHDVFRVFGKLKTETEKVAEFVHQTYSRYQKLAEGAGLTAEKIAAMERLFKPADGELFVAGKNHVFYSVQ